MDTGVAQNPIQDMVKYKHQLAARLNPTASTINLLYQRASTHPKRVVYAEGEDEKIVRAASLWCENDYGKAILVGNEEKVASSMAAVGVNHHCNIVVENAAVSRRVDVYIDFLYKKLHRKGFLHRDCVRMVKNDRNIFAACMLACGDADAMVTGVTRSYYHTLDTVLKVIDPKPNHKVFAMSMIIAGGRSLFISDTAVNESPSAEDLVDIAIQTVDKVVHIHHAHEPRVAFLSFSNFGDPDDRDTTKHIREAVKLMDERKVSFKYEGEMSADVALNTEIAKLYPFCRLSGPANVLIMPTLHAANVSTKLLRELGGGNIIGPMLSGLSHPVQIVPMGASVSEIMNLTALAAVDAID
jgi:malate dehydrogenase (oxaloacetate-decarboxylating)(NADP+)